jgi:hypothetical protein
MAYAHSAEAHTVGYGEPSPARNNQPLTNNDGERFAKAEAHTAGYGEPSPARNNQPLTNNDGERFTKNEVDREMALSIG